MTCYYYCALMAFSGTLAERGAGPVAFSASTASPACSVPRPPTAPV